MTDNIERELKRQTKMMAERRAAGDFAAGVIASFVLMMVGMFVMPVSWSEFLIEHVPWWCGVALPFLAGGLYAYMSYSRITLD